MADMTDTLVPLVGLAVGYKIVEDVLDDEHHHRKKKKHMGLEL